MALRVLLADESSTIKKVMQLALQDFSVEVKAVPTGNDVLTVAQSFKPDIIFADILLPQKSGYEVCSQIKNHPGTQKIPVVLMWSGFMEIDHEKAYNAMADGRLEKPFDADILRSTVTDLIPDLATNDLSQFLNFPTMPSFEESPKSEHTKSSLKLAGEETQNHIKIPVPPPKKAGSGNTVMMTSPHIPPPSPKAAAPLPPKMSENSPPPPPLTKVTSKVDLQPLELLDVPEEAAEEFTSMPLYPVKEENDLEMPEGLEDDVWSQKPIAKFKLDVAALEANNQVQLDKEEISKKYLAEIEELDSKAISFEEMGSFSEVEELTRSSYQYHPEPALAEKNSESEEMVSFDSPNQFKYQEQDSTQDSDLDSHQDLLASQNSEKEFSSQNLSGSNLTGSNLNLSKIEIEKMVRQEVREVLESVAWKILPDMMERIVREEIAKLLRDTEKTY